MSLATNVIRRGGRYVYRARVPADLVARLGRFEIIRSLKTADPGMARRRASRVGSSFHLIWDKVRNDPMLRCSALTLDQKAGGRKAPD
jgi:hypothetical protein